MGKLKTLNEFLSPTKEEKTCLIKVAFPTKGEAKKSGRQLSKTLSVPIYCYHCDICYDFHLTKMKEFHKKQHTICQ